MPTGNGDIGLNVWVEESGDLLFYIGKTDLWDDNSRLLKLGRARAKNEGSRSRPSGDRTTIGSPIRIMEGSCSKRSRRC